MEEQHPVPRQITTFEFKLIGFMTLKQFVYLIVFFPLGYIVFRLFPIPFLNVLLGLFFALMGIALAFVPVNDRPLDIYVKNLFRRLTSPTQFFYRKKNDPPYFLQGMARASPDNISTHIDAKEKLSQYLSLKKGAPKENKKEREKAQVGALLQEDAGFIAPSQDAHEEVRAVQGADAPFFTGMIKTSKGSPVPGVLIYIKDGTGKTVRLLKSNPHGVFATHTVLPEGEYEFELKDPKGNLFFDTMKIKLDGPPVHPFEFFSKELI